MAKGNKKKRSDRTTPDMILDTLTANDSTSSVSSEREAPESDAASARSVAREKTTEAETHRGPVLSNIIIQRYEGEKCGDVFHGEGVAVFQGGHVYKGSFADGLMHGRGEYTWADGVKYEGDFVSNVPMGHGTYTWLDGSTYVGDVCFGIRHGVGSYKCANTLCVYKGQWQEGRRHGKGTIYYNIENTSWYEGEWENNHREGFGVRRYPSGNIYQGQWKNNVRHGEGTMKWIQLGQQYSGQWINGVQHGQGTHTWFLRRVPGSQYPLRNEYKGDFVQGLRHGQGTFSYASGAVYTGGWKHNKKHGQGKFIFKNGRIFEGEFLNDRMAEFPAFFIDGANTPDLSGIRTQSPPLDEGDLPRRAKKSEGTASLLGTDIALSIEVLLNRIPEAQREHELRQVEFAIMRHITLLRAVYSHYSSLGHDHSPDNTYLLTRLQFCRFLKDCAVHQHGLTLAQIDRLINEGVSQEEVLSPFSTILLRKCLSYIVIAAYHIYHKDIGTSSNVLVQCFTKLIRENIIPNAKNVKGPLFCHPGRAVIGMNYTERCWEIYQALCKANCSAVSDQTMTARHFIWMMKDFGLFDSELTTTRLLEILSSESPAIYNTAHSNLDLEITFLEFFEALLGCAEIKTMNGVKESQDETATSFKDQTQNCPLLSHMSSPQYKSTNPVIAKPLHEDSPVTLESSEEVRPKTGLECWIQRTHQFFNQIFFPAYEHNLLLKDKVQEERLNEIAKNKIALEKAKENARLREQCEAEEERHRVEEHEDEQGEVTDDYVNHSPPALVTPVASSASLGLKPTSGSKKKKK